MSCGRTPAGHVTRCSPPSLKGSSEPCGYRSPSRSTCCTGPQRWIKMGLCSFVLISTATTSCWMRLYTRGEAKGQRREEEKGERRKGRREARGQRRKVKGGRGLFQHVLLPCSFRLVPLPFLALVLVAGRLLFPIAPSREGLEPTGEVAQATAHQPVHRAFLFDCTGADTGEQLYALIDGADRIEVKLPLAYRLNDICPQHQVTHVGCRDHDALPTSQALHAADIKKSLDLFVHAANGLYLAPLVHR